MTITLYLQKETLLKDLKTLTHIFQYNAKSVEVLRKHYEFLNISTEQTRVSDVAIQVSLEEFALIGVFNGEI